MSKTLPPSATSANAAVFEATSHDDFIDGSVHIKHARLRRRFELLVARVVARARRSSVVPRVLDLGAGDGYASRPFLNLGCRVTAVDVAAGPLHRFSQQVNAPDQLAVLVGDVDGQLADLAERGAQFDIVVTCSVLHHLPDYLGFLERAIAVCAPTSQILTFHDPLRYDSLDRVSYVMSFVAYGAWRVTKPDLWGGTRRRVRRLRGIYIDDCDYDNAEYHVTRNGVDQDAIPPLLDRFGFRSRVFRYFSAHSGPWQALGEDLGLTNTFAVVGRRSVRRGLQTPDEG